MIFRHGYKSRSWSPLAHGARTYCTCTCNVHVQYVQYVVYMYACNASRPLFENTNLSLWPEHVNYNLMSSVDINGVGSAAIGPLEAKFHYRPQGLSFTVHALLYAPIGLYQLHAGARLNSCDPFSGRRLKEAQRIAIRVDRCPFLYASKKLLQNFILGRSRSRATTSRGTCDKKFQLQRRSRSRRQVRRSTR